MILFEVISAPLKTFLHTNNENQINYIPFYINNLVKQIFFGFSSFSADYKLMQRTMFYFIKQIF